MAATKPLTDRKKIALIDTFGSAKKAFAAKKEELRDLPFLKPKDVDTILSFSIEKSTEEEYRDICRRGIRLVTYHDPSYPFKLKNIDDPPYALFVRGELPAPGEVLVSIVGARSCSAYGREAAKIFAAELAKAGISVVSGMARGIDGISQRACLNAGGRSYGVLGCGVDICYPREHIELFMQLQEQGGLISEVLPGTEPVAYNFPRRNRIISGLSDILLVMEAREKSGSLITVDAAMEQGKDVYALPGPFDNPLSAGCHQLIRQGAGILISPKELLLDIRNMYPAVLSGEKQPDFDESKKGRGSSTSEKNLESKNDMVYSCLGLFPKNLEQLISETGLSPSDLLDALVTLQILGMAEEISKNHYIIKR